VAPTRAPRGFTARLAATQFGLYLAVLAPLTGGLSVKIQHLVGVDAAPTQLGIVSGTGAVLAMVCQPLAGRLSDRCSARIGMRRPFILGGIGGVIVGMTYCAFATSMPALLVGWCVTQAAANLAFAATGATVADQVPDAQRGRVSGIVGAVTPLGVLAGAVMLTVLPTDALRFLVPTAVATALGAWFVVRLPDRVRARPPADHLDLRGLLLSFVFDPRAHPEFGWAWLSKFLIMLGYSALSGYLTLFLAARFGMHDTDEQLRFNAIANTVGVLTLVVFSVVGGFLSDRLGRRKPFVIAAGLIMATAQVGVATTPLMGSWGLAALLFWEVVLGAGAGMFFAVDTALCIALLPSSDDTAKDLGVLNIANALPQSLAPLLAGVLVIPVGQAIWPGAGYSMWFVVAASCCAAGALLIPRITTVD
jgi:MFS family permease